MSEYWVSEGRQWCKYCRIFISSNINQVLQHQSGRKHINNEENYVREIANKVRATNAGSAAVADQVLAQVAELKAKAEMKARGEEPEPAPAPTPTSAAAAAATRPASREATHVPLPVTANVELKTEDQEEKKKLESDDGEYPAPATYGPWVKVEIESDYVKDESTEVKEEPTTVPDDANQSKPKRRIGALDDDDEEDANLKDAERAARFEADPTQAWDELDKAFKKRPGGGGGMKKRRRRR